MVSIFVSHAWKNEADTYNRFVKLLDSALGIGNWKNLSIPESKPISLLASSEMEGELDGLEDELIQVVSAMRKPGLPNVYSKVVWEADGTRREEVSVGSLAERHEQIVGRMRKLADRLPEEYVRPYEVGVSKDESGSIRLHPELSLAIRRRILDADLTFVLVTPVLCLPSLDELRDCRFRKQVEQYCVAVESGGHVSPELRLTAAAVISANLSAIRSVVETRDVVP